MNRFLIVCIALFCAAPLAGCLPEEFMAETTSSAEDFDGPEALNWLKNNRNESALASNRFGPTENAVRFVQGLYNAGALRVVIPREHHRRRGHAEVGERTVRRRGGGGAAAKLRTARESLGNLCPRNSPRGI